MPRKLTEAIFLYRRYLAVSSDIVTLSKLDTQANRLLTGRGQGHCSTACDVHDSSLQGFFNLDQPLCQGSESLPYTVDERSKETNQQLWKGLNERLEGVNERAKDDWEEIQGAKKIW